MLPVHHGNSSLHVFYHLSKVSSPENSDSLNSLTFLLLPKYLFTSAFCFILAFSCSVNFSTVSNHHPAMGNFLLLYAYIPRHSMCQNVHITVATPDFRPVINQCQFNHFTQIHCVFIYVDILWLVTGGSSSFLLTIQSRV